MARVDSVRVLDGFEIIELPSYSNSLKRLERRYRGVNLDINAFLHRLADVVLVRGLPFSAVHVNRLRDYGPGFFEAKRIPYTKGLRCALRLIFRVDSMTRRIDLVDLFSKNDSEVWLPPCSNSGNRRHMSVALRQAE
jgi:hypothetical protein